MSVSLVYETHSTTVDNEERRATGWLPGELSRAGRDEARALGLRRRDDGLALVVSSDLARAVQTVEIAFAGSSVPIVLDPRLRECDYGVLTGGPLDEVRRQRRRYVDQAFPQGESYLDVAARVESCLQELARDHEGERVLLVGHAATRFALDLQLAGRPLEAAVDAPFGWRPGWEYELGTARPVMAVLDAPLPAEACDALTEVYRTAFGASGYGETEHDARRFHDEQLPAHQGRAGFRCAVLRLADEVVGFGYGYTGERGQWWSDRVVDAVPEALADAWVGGHFEVVELAVAVSHQGHGYGAALMDALLLDLPHDHALLGTYRGDRPAPRLYARQGWELLHQRLTEDSDLWGRHLR